MGRMQEAVLQYRDLILEAERFLWEHPAPGYREWEADAYLKERFEELGYQLTEPGDIPGFITQIDTGRPGPCVLVMAEMDSLIIPGHPEAQADTGAVHACGHHAQGAAMVGLAAALTEPGILNGLSGSIRLCCVPAEELIQTTWREELRKKGTIRFFGGKIEYMYRGLFDGADIAFMVHASNNPDLDFTVEEGNNGCIVKNIAYEGKSAHAGGAPHQGINALYAANLGLSAINALRETFEDDKHVRVHPIVTAGGSVVNAIPDLVTMESYVRAKDLDAIIQANEKVNRALAGTAAAMGANVRITDRAGYAPLHCDRNLADAAILAAQEVTDPSRCAYVPNWSTGCTDLGDVSCVMPTVQINVAGATGTAHGVDFALSDPETACVKSACMQAELLDLLLRNDAEVADEIVRRSDPPYDSIQEYLEVLEENERDARAVTYEEDGTVQLKW